MESLASMKALIEQLHEAARAYYQEDREIMSNFAYDALYDALVALEASTGIQLANSPTRQVGYAVLDSLVKVPHTIPMLSLDKTKEPAKLAAFLGTHTGLLSWKLDGLTIVLRYANGTLVQAVTRGNGQIGEDVTHTARVFENIPLRIPFVGELVLRGEAVIRQADFVKINETIIGEKYKNPRNLCSGSVRQLNSEAAAERHLRFYAFGIVYLTPDENRFNDLKSNQLQWLASLGFEVVAHTRVTAENVVETISAFKAKMSENEVASDGLVLTYDSLSYSDSLGATAKFPRDAIAFKWADELSETTLLDIEWNTSRTGLINPIAVFEPVEIEGTTVNKASLHNVSIVKNLALGIGDRITVYKANMIIPQVAENITRSGTAIIPEKCPVCCGETEILRQKEGEALYCVNPNCRAQLISALTHFASRDALNIEGLSEQTLEKFVERGFIGDYTDIFTLARYEQEIVMMEGFGVKSYQNLLNAIEKAKSIQLPHFIYALGIRQVGLSNAKLLCMHYAYDLQRIINAARDPLYQETLSQIKGFGEAIAHSLHVYFSDERNLALLQKAVAYLHVAPPPVQSAVRGVFQDLTFVITGDVNQFENRKALQRFIEQHGGRCTGSVTTKTAYLVNNDALSESGKNKKAKAIGVPIITEAELIKRAQNSASSAETDLMSPERS